MTEALASGNAQHGHKPVQKERKEKMDDWEDALDGFFEANKDHLVKTPNATGEELDAYLWDDYSAVKEKLREISTDEPGRYCYTLTEGDDGNAYIHDGWHFVNRLGYFISTKPVLDEVYIRYW